MASDFSGDRIGLEVGPGAEIDVLRIRVLPGVRRIDRFLSVGAGARIGVIEVKAAEQTGARRPAGRLRADPRRRRAIEAMRFRRSTAAC